MFEILPFVATLSAALFAGAALYINIVEHSARMRGDTRAALVHWTISYKRATLMQAPLALAGLAASVAAWLFGANASWLIAGLLIGAAVPFTLIVIMPANRKLLATDRDSASTETRALLDRWGKLHAVRTILSLLATALMLWQLCTAG